MAVSNPATIYVPMFFLLITAAAHLTFGVFQIQFGQYNRAHNPDPIIRDQLYKMQLPTASYAIITGGVMVIYVLLACVSLQKDNAMLASISWVGCWAVTAMSFAVGVIAALMFYIYNRNFTAAGVDISILPSEIVNFYWMCLADAIATFALGLPCSFALMHAQIVNRAGEAAVVVVKPRQSEMSQGYRAQGPLIA